MDRQTIVRKFLEIAAAVAMYSVEVAAAIRRAANSEDIEYTWLVRWSYSGHEWENNPSTPKRIIGRSLVLAACGEWQKRLPWIIPENGRYQAIWVQAVEPLNKRDLEDAKRARELGMDVHVQARYPKPTSSVITTKEAFEDVVATTRPVWVEDSIRGHVVTGEEPGYDEEGRPISVPTFGDAIEHGPGFKLEGVPTEWVGTYSNLTAFSADGSTRFYAPFSGGGGGPVHLEEVPEDAEWRVPRQFVEQILELMEATSQLRKEEEETLKRTREDTERKRLAAKFGVPTTGPVCGYCGHCEYCNYGQQ